MKGKEGLEGEPHVLSPLFIHLVTNNGWPAARHSRNTCAKFTFFTHTKVQTMRFFDIKHCLETITAAPQVEDGRRREVAGGCKLGCHSSKVVCGGGGAFKLAGYQATLPGLQQAQRSDGPHIQGLLTGLYNTMHVIRSVRFSLMQFQLIYSRASAVHFWDFRDKNLSVIKKCYWTQMPCFFRVEILDCLFKAEYGCSTKSLFTYHSKKI